MLTKADFVQRYQRGEFGNASPTWSTFEEFESYSKRYKSNVEAYHSALYHLRSKIAGGPTLYNLRTYYAYVEWYRRVVNGEGSNWYCSAMCPHEHNLLQGEVLQTEQGLYLNYSTVVGKPMREALALESKHAYGILAVCLLRGAMCPNSYEWLQVLLDRYPGHTVEFTALGIKWGTLPHYNTLFWEVRKGY